MDFVIGIIIGFVVFMIIKDKPIKIEITQKNVTPATVEIPEMSDILKNGKNPEDDAYASMGSVLDAVNDLMNGGGSHDKE